MTGATCGATTRAGTPCRRPQGWGTDHPGHGRCKLHGGLSPIKTGLYSTVARGRAAELLALAEAEPIADTTAEIHLLQAQVASVFEQLCQLDETGWMGFGDEVDPRPGLRRELTDALDRLIRAKDRQLDRQHGVESMLVAFAEVAASVIAAFVPERHRERAVERLRDALVGTTATRAGVGRSGAGRA